MKITVNDILTKYPTNFDLNKVTDELKNTIIFGDGKHGLRAEEITLDDLKEPTHTESGDHDKYTCKIGEFTVIIGNYLDTFTVDVTWPSVGDMLPYSATWLNDGSRIHY